jgi:hypothetical protein
VGSACLLLPMRPPEDFTTLAGVFVIAILVVFGVLGVFVAGVEGRKEEVGGLLLCSRVRGTWLRTACLLRPTSPPDDFTAGAGVCFVPFSVGVGVSVVVVAAGVAG